MLSENERLLAHWINERHRIWRRRFCLKQPKPWTDDEVMQNVYFCNVRREHDKVTQWIHHNIRVPGAKSPRITPTLVWARLFNLPSHMEVFVNTNPKVPLMPFHIDPACRWDTMRKVSKHWRDRGNKCFNGAYIVSTAGKKMDKIDYVYDVVESVDEWYRDRREICDWVNTEYSLKETPLGETLESAHESLTQINGLGSFLAAQVVADLKNTPEHPLSKASDWWTWCAPGPGSVRGLAWALGIDRVSPKGFAQGANTLYGRIDPYLTINGNICMQDFQNCLCEFDKYMRVRTGKGRSKRKYNGT
jgi:hypothetical protein